MSGQSSKPDDLRFATNEERRFALAYLRWLAGGEGRRRGQPHATHPRYALTPVRGQQIREDIESMVRDASEQLRQSHRRATPPAAERPASSAGSVDHGAPQAAEAAGQ